MTAARRPARVHSLLDVDDAAMMPPVREMTVAPVPMQELREFVWRYHHTGHTGMGLRRFGLWHGMTLLGVIAFGMPTPRAARSVFGAAGAGHVWDMSRLMLADVAPHNSESRLIGGAMRLVAANDAHVWAVLSFADPAAGHLGYVYQATNALYTGTGGNPVYYVDELGSRRAPNSNGSWITREQAESRGWSKHVGPPKHRYLYLIGTRAERRARRAALRLPVLPYPKDLGGAAVPDV